MTTRGRDLRPALTAAFAIGGYAFTIALLVVGFSNKQWPFPGGDVVDYYAPVGDRLREGLSIYPPEFLVTPPGFLYGPPWAVAFASISWLGAGAIHAVILVLDLVALWTIAWGDWRRLGYLLWFPLVAFELAAGQVNLIIAAAIVAAQRGIVWPLAIVTFGKVWPALALPIRYWRPFLIAFGLVALVTLPWLYLWPQWVAALLDAAPHPLGPVVPISWLPRAAIAAVLLLLLRRPWARALAAMIVSPNLYWGQLVVLVAPVSLWLQRHELASDDAVVDLRGSLGEARVAE